MTGLEVLLSHPYIARDKHCDSKREIQLGWPGCLGDRLKQVAEPMDSHKAWELALGILAAIETKTGRVSQPSRFHFSGRPTFAPRQTHPFTAEQDALEARLLQYRTVETELGGLGGFE